MKGTCGSDIQTFASMDRGYDKILIRRYSVPEFCNARISEYRGVRTMRLTNIYGILPVRDVRLFSRILIS
jgi:hypothetical protein